MWLLFSHSIESNILKRIKNDGLTLASNNDTFIEPTYATHNIRIMCYLWIEKENVWQKHKQMPTITSRCLVGCYHKTKAVDQMCRTSNYYHFNLIQFTQTVNISAFSRSLILDCLSLSVCHFRSEN